MRACGIAIIVIITSAQYEAMATVWGTCMPFLYVLVACCLFAVQQWRRFLNAATAAKHAAAAAKHALRDAKVAPPHSSRVVACSLCDG